MSELIPEQEGGLPLISGSAQPWGFSRVRERLVLITDNCEVHARCPAPTPTGASLSSKQCTNFLPGSLSLSQTDKSKEICVMCWEHESQEKVLGLIFAVNDCREEPLLLWDG